MNKKWRISFKRESVIGSGAFGVVFRGTLTTENGTTVLVAVTRIWGDWSSTKIEDDRELVQLKLDHPNVLRLFHWEDHGEFR